MTIEFKAQKTCIFGIQGSGKTFFAKQMYPVFKKPIIYMVNDDDDWQKLKGLYIWKADRKNVKEDFGVFIRKAHEWAMEGKIDAIIIDEADLFFANNYDLKPPQFLDLILNHRHIPSGKGTALWFLTRRPQDIPTKIVESCKNLIIFKLEGANAIQRFKEIHPLLPEAVERLEYHKHNFVVKELGKEPYIHYPIKPRQKSEKSRQKTKV